MEITGIAFPQIGTKIKVPKGGFKVIMNSKYSLFYGILEYV